jgi:signal transduction histidine kinase/DNA-binding response OmpR family regulator
MPDTKGTEILIVEDSPTQAEELQYTLEQHGYLVRNARNGAEALSAIGKRRPTLIVSDIVMPGMDGFTLCKKIKSEIASEIPVILLTSLSDPQDVLKGLECGADNFITKPYDGNYLLTRIHHILVNAKLRNSSNKQLGVELLFKGQRYFITSERQQILDLLLSTYETAIMKNDELKEARGKLETMNEQLEKTVQERTMALLVEIEERKKAENAAKIERKRLYDVLETLPVMICLLTPDHYISFANRSFREKFGESKGRHCYEYCFGYPEPCAFCESYKALETGKPHHWEVTTPDGKSIIDVFDFPFTDVDGSPLILEMDIDITDRKRTEAELAKHREQLEALVHERTGELEAANKELESFAYTVSHDLRAPIRSIEAFSRAIEEEKTEQLDDNGKDYLRRVRAATQNMSQLIEAMLRLSRLSRGELRRSKVDLSTLARNVADELKKAEPERKVEFQIADSLTVEGDPAMLGAAIDNLMRNAWKFTGNNPEAKIEVGSSQKDGKTTFFVRDDGVGFNMNYVSKMFTPFQRLHRTTEFPGIGIGLATVQRIIHRHGGIIWAEGEVDKGATFYFTLN